MGLDELGSRERAKRKMPVQSVGWFRDPIATAVTREPRAWPVRRCLARWRSWRARRAGVLPAPCRFVVLASATFLVTTGSRSMIPRELIGPSHLARWRRSRGHRVRGSERHIAGKCRSTVDAGEIHPHFIQGKRHIVNMPTWQHKKREAAQRAELFGEHEECGIQNEPSSGMSTGGSAPSRNGPSWNQHTHHGGSHVEKARSPTWVKSRAGANSGSSGVSAGLRPGGYFSPQSNRDSVDSNSSAASLSSTFVQKRMVHRAIQQHQGATASAERSLAVAENCLDIGVTTLEEVARQGEGLDKAERGLDMLEEEVQEADSLIKFMSRCCLFQVLCCCCAESKEEIRRDRTRKQRLKQRRGEDEVVRRAISLATQDKKSSYGFFETEDDEELERVAAKYRPASQRVTARRHEMARNPHQNIITDEQINIINNETRKQDELLDHIGDVVDKLKIVGEALQTEFEEQDAQVERLEGRAVESKYSLSELTTKARKIR